MKKKCSAYMSEEISRFVDNELPQDIQDAVARHLCLCRECSRLVEQYRALGLGFDHHATQKIHPLGADTLKKTIPHPIKASRTPPWAHIFGFLGKNIYLKLASIAAILIISLIPFQRGMFDPSGPSAIVKSVDTDVASVMIIETQKEKHTIIWFSET